MVNDDVSLINIDNSGHDNAQEDVVNCDNIVESDNESDLANYATEQTVRVWEIRKLDGAINIIFEKILSLILLNLKHKTMPFHSERKTKQETLL